MTVKQRVPMEEYSTTLTPPMEHPLTEAPNPHIVKTDDENNHPPVEEESADNEMTTSCKQTTTEKCKQQQQLADVVNLVVSNEPKTANNMTKREEKPEETGDEINETNTKEMVESSNNETKNVVNNETREINKPKPTKQPSSDLDPTSGSPSISSSSVSLNELPIKNIIEKSNSTESSDCNEEKSIQVPMPLVEENKEPGIMSFLTVPQVVTLLDDRDPPPKIKKAFLKGLYAANKDLSAWQCVPRWPAESQVLPQSIKHIRSVPGVPEVFYEPTGKEPCPRPLGEDHGMVVFDYMPTSPVNYFSRSVLGPSKDHPPDPSAAPLQPPIEPPLPDCLKFESRFESGNLAKVIRITEAYYEIYLRPDYYTSKHCQWFYFQVQNMRSDLTYRFSIVNFSKPDSLYNYGMKPVLYSQIEAERHFVGWSRVGSNIRYYRNESIFDEEDGYSFTLTFTINFPHDNDTVYLAHCYPYTYSDLQEDLSSIQSNIARSQFCSQRLLCRTLAGNNVYILTITSPASEEELKRKSVILLSARVHPGEAPSSWIMRGILHFLTGDSQVAADLRDKFIFKVVPMLNPDGVIVGNTRCSLAARDLNRQYKSVIKEAFPPVFNVKTVIRRLMEENGVVFYCDLHAHSRKFNVFMYGCENRRHSEKYLREQVFPLMLHKNTAEKFSFEDCRFKIQRQKESTGRVVFWNMGITCSYTMEASYGGTNMGSRAFTHFNTDDYEGVGRYFCETLLDFYDPCPVKEELRNKIVSRLLREGSSADEPSNIAMSDYSSLSSGCESSSDDEDANKGNNDGDDESAAEEREEKRRIRKLRSRRDRCKNGVQFTQTLHPDFRKSERFEVKKSLSDIAMKVSSKNTTPSRDAMTKWAKSGKKSKKKFKRSLTMTALPLSFFKGCGNNTNSGNDLKVPNAGNMNNLNSTNNNTEQNVTKFTIDMMSLNGDNCYPIDVAENANLENLGDLYMKIKNQDNVDSSFPDDLMSLSSRNVDSFSVEMAGKSNSKLIRSDHVDVSDPEGLHSSGTSDEDDCGDGDDRDRDLEKLFCPLTDSNGAPYEGQNDQGSERLSASNCRRVQDEIMASLSSFKSSFLGRKGGFLHNYAMLEASTSNQSNTDTDHTTTPIKVTPPTPGRGKSQSMKVKSSRSGSLSATGTLKKNTNNSGVNSPTNTINISLPSPAGTAAMRSSSKSKSIGNKKWEKYNKVKKAIKTHSDEEILQPPTKPRGRIGSTASLSSLRWNNDSGSETPRLKPKTSRKKKKSSNKTGSLSKLNNKA